jgi:hypothetical protein
MAGRLTPTRQFFFGPGASPERYDFIGVHREICEQMKRTVVTAVVLLLTCQMAIAGLQSSTARPAKADIKTSMVGPLVVGEKLTYEVSWADFLVAGELTIETRERREFDGIDGFHIVAQAQSVGLVRAAAYKVDDIYESFVDASTFEPFRAEKQTRHGKKREQESVSIDQRSRQARLSDGRTVALRSTAYDLAGLLVAIRTMDFKGNKPKALTLLDEGKQYDLEIAVDGREKISTRAGSFNAVRLVTKAIGRTQTDPYKLRIFVSDDSRRWPVLITAQPRWGSVRVELTRAVGGAEATKSGKAS